MMTSDEIRTAFLSFFEEKGHKIIPSSPLMPQGDPTLLLTTAGMVQFKPYFLGEASPPSHRLASCQKCFRTTDIESVGDTTHLTFFEMLGNFSIGDYFKREAISWAWEFVTQRLNLSPERLWVTIFVDDDESFDIWREIGVSEQRILRCGEEDNSWGPAGNSGPCGPCSEIHYDFGEEFGCGKTSCAPNCDCGRFSEIWNLVFTQYNQDESGQRTLLPKPNIDTGMGLERTATVMQGKTSVYETDLFATLFECVSGLVKRKYGTGANGDIENAMRVVAEHSRGIAFLIGDGVMPSNEGRGYVLRRLLRRAALFGRRLGLDRPFLAETAMTTIEQMGDIYPELVQRQDFILRVIELEETRFGETLSTGLELLDGIIEKATSKGKNKISGKETFKLYDTYGFPVELTMEIAAGRGFSVDLEGFEREMGKQRERAKASNKFEMAEKEAAGLREELDIKMTPFTGYSNLKQKTTILNLLVDNDPVETVKAGQKASLILGETPFYGEMGGQMGDTGEIRSSSGKFSVINTIRVQPDVIVHQGKVTKGSLTAGDEVEAEVDEERRLDIARNHTATHLLQAALREVLGEHIQQRGSLVAPDRLRFDFSYLTGMTKEEIQKVNHIVNEKIRQNLMVYDEEIPYKKAVEGGAIALFDEKYGDVVRVLRIGRPLISAELCGGTHVATTGEIAFFHVTGESSIGAGLRRIEAVTGRGAEALIDKRLSDLQEAAEYVEAEPDNVSDKVYSLSIELKNERRRIQALEKELSKRKVESLEERAKEVRPGIKLVVERVDDNTRIDTLREISDFLKDKLGSVIVVLGTVYEDKPIFIAAVTPDLVVKGYNAGEIVKQVAMVTGGGGGGKATLAQAGGRYKDKLDEALGQVERLI
ncbi:alanine--tRNA ligase [Chloroflexota bacterium]